MPSYPSLVEAVLLLFAYDNLDVLTTFSNLQQASFSYLQDKTFWIYFCARTFLSFFAWLLIISQESPLISNDLLLGAFIFLVQIGVVQNFTLRLGKYDIGFLPLFSNIRNRIIGNMQMTDNLKELKRKTWDELENRYSLEELKMILNRAFAYKETPLKQREQETQNLKDLTNGLTDEMKEPYYAAKIVKVGGIQFAEQVLKGSQSTDKESK